MKDDAPEGNLCMLPTLMMLCLQGKTATIFILLMTSQAMSLFLALYHLSAYLISRRRKKEARKEGRRTAHCTKIGYPPVIELI